MTAMISSSSIISSTIHTFNNMLAKCNEGKRKQLYDYCLLMSRIFSYYEDSMSTTLQHSYLIYWLKFYRCSSRFSYNLALRLNISQKQSSKLSLLYQYCGCSVSFRDQYYINPQVYNLFYFTFKNYFHIIILHAYSNWKSNILTSSWSTASIIWVGNWVANDT